MLNEVVIAQDYQSFIWIKCRIKFF